MKKTAFGMITLLFLISVGGSLPIMYFNLIEPRLGLMNANIGIGALEIAAVDDATITFIIKLRVMGPFDKAVIVPKLDLTAYAGVLPMGVAWSPMEFTVLPWSFLLDFNAYLYLRVFRGQGSGTEQLFSSLLHESDIPITLSGDAYIGGLPFPMPPMTFSMTPSPLDPMGLILDALSPEEEETDMITEFLTYLEANGVNLEEMASAISLDAAGLLEFLDKYGMNIFGLFYYMDVGQEWTKGFGIDNNSKIENRENRIGVQQAINALETADPSSDIMSNLLKIAWDLDDTEHFNGTNFSRGEITAPQPYIDWAIGPNIFYFNQSRNPEIFYENLLLAGVNSLLRESDKPLESISPQRNGSNYFDNTTEKWTIIPDDNFTISPDKEVHYLRFMFSSGPTLDIEGDGNPDTFTADNLTFSYLDIDNNSNPVTLMYDEDNMLEMLGGGWATPLLPTNSVNITFKTNDAINQTGFDIYQIVLDYDTPFPIVHTGNYTPAEAPVCHNLDNDTIDADHKQYFNPTAYLIFDIWHTVYILNQSYGIPWEDAWVNATLKGYDLLRVVSDPPTSPIDDDWTSDGMTFWDLLWWVNNHYDVRYLLNISNSNETIFLFDNLYQLMNPLNQADFFYGDVIWNNGTHKGMLKDIVPDFPTMSPAHAFVDFAPGAQFENMSEPLNYIRLWERNPSTGNFDVFYDNYTHTDIYGLPDIPGTGGPYAADVGYMKALKYNSTGFLDNMLYLALTQDSRDPNSLWRMMYDETKRIMGASFNETEFNITHWNTKPLPLNIFLEAIANASEATGGDGGGIESLLYGIDLFGMMEYITQKSGTSIGDILDAAGVQTYQLLDFFADNINPIFTAETLLALESAGISILPNPNTMTFESLLFILIPAFVAIPAIAIYLYLTKEEPTPQKKS